MIALIAAVAKNDVIGDSGTGKMPWHVSSELKFFKSQTVGKTIVMGRRTAESVGTLPNRRRIALTTTGFPVEGFAPMNFDMVMKENDQNPDKEMMICGGAEIYRLFMPYAESMIISRLPFDAKGDVLFPKFNSKKSNDWTLDMITRMGEFSVYKYKNRNPLKYA